VRSLRPRAAILRGLLLYSALLVSGRSMTLRSAWEEDAEEEEELLLWVLVGSEAVMVGSSAIRRAAETDAQCTAASYAPAPCRVSRAPAATVQPGTV
jgi:hypothetical protein